MSARPPIAHIMSYYGYSDEVMQLMKTLAHATWAYIINANGLHGFVIQVPLIKILKDADKEDKFQQARKW